MPLHVADSAQIDRSDHVDHGHGVSRNFGISNPSPSRASQLVSAPAHHACYVTSPQRTELPVRQLNTRANEAIFCRNCLIEGHYASSRSSKIRCRVCFGYGHIARNCFNKARKSQIYRKKISEPGNILTGRQGDAALPPNLLRYEGSLELSGDSLPSPPHASLMANYPCDFIPHLLVGAGFIPPNGLRPQHGYVMVEGSLPLSCDA